MTPRKSTSERGYGHVHQTLRKAWSGKVHAGGVLCARCGRLIRPGEFWDLDHVDGDKSRYNGPAHRKCNRGASNKRRVASRQW